MYSIPRKTLAKWAESKPTIKTLYVFGSYATGRAHQGSDLDLAFEFVDVDDPLAELISNAASWKTELTGLTGIPVKDVYLNSDRPAQTTRVLVYSR
jgi:predicted nucleotidyltransferase